MIDLVGIGGATSVEASAAPNPEEPESSLERKAVAAATADSMSGSGGHANHGNGYDSDNNANDFILRVQGEPQNTVSSPEFPSQLPVPNPSPTPTPYVVPSPIPEPSTTPTPPAINTPVPTTSPDPSPTKKPWPHYRKLSVRCELKPIVFVIWGRRITIPHRVCLPYYEYRNY